MYFCGITQKRENGNYAQAHLCEEMEKSCQNDSEYYIDYLHTNITKSTVINAIIFDEFTAVPPPLLKSSHSGVLGDNY